MAELENPFPDCLMTSRQAAAYLQVSPSTLERWRRVKSGPSFIRLGGPVRGPIRYRVADLDDFVIRSTSHPGADEGAF